MSVIIKELLSEIDLEAIENSIGPKDGVYTTEAELLIAEVRRQRELIAGLAPLAKLGVEAIEECVWQGCCNFDDGDILESATKIGAIQEAAEGYDPALHGESDLCEPGDKWFEFPPAVMAAKRWLEEGK